MNKLKKFFLKHGFGNYRASSESYIHYLRKKGVKIGGNVRIFQPKTVMIDFSKPSLLEIGNDVVITGGSSILTHGYDWVVLQNVYNETLGSSKKVCIGSNVFIGFNSLILKGVTIGNNVIIGAGTVVTKDVPPNSVISGVPGRVICTLEQYYQKRKKDCIDEAKAYARSIKECFNRMPEPSDFTNEFPLFSKAGECPKRINKRKILGNTYDHYCKYHVPVYNSFEDFLEDAFNST